MDVEYKKLYDDLINNAKKENRQKRRISDKNYICYHDHHIVPKSIAPELDKEPSNQVLLTPEEHFDAHYFLWKAYPEEVKYAVCFYFISHTVDGKELTKEEYGELKRAEQLWLSENRKGEKNPMFRRNAYEGKTEEEMKEIGEKISQKLKGKPKGIRIYNEQLGIERYVNSIYEIPEGFIIGRKPSSEETRDKMSKSAKQRGTPHCAFRDKNGKNNPMYGKKQSITSKTKSSLTRKQKKLENPNYGTGGKKVYHNPETREFKYFLEGQQPKNWIQGRPKKS